MRISNAMIQQGGAAGLASTQSSMVQLEQEISTGRRILSPATDPAAAGQAVSVADAQAQLAAYSSAQTQVTNQLSSTDTVMSSMQNVLQSLRQSLVQAGNTALAPSDRQAIAASLQSDYQQLLGLANSRGADGNYLFGGFSQTNQPFVATATGARYEGDQGTKVVQVGAGRSIQGSINGADLFLRVRDGNGTFATAQSSTNTGTGVIDGGSVSNAAQWTSDTYSISFSQSGTATQYTVTDQTLGTTVAGPSDFSAGAAIAFDGISVGITGTPAAGDTFSVTPSRNSDVFSQIKSAIALVSGSVSGGSAGANYSAGIASQLQFIDQATSQLLSQRAVVGANLQALSTLKTMTGTQSTQLQTQMSSLRDVDYASAVSQFAAAQTAYQAAQASYAKVAQMTLFDKI